MYNFFEDKSLLRKIRKSCSNLVKELENELRKNGLNSQVFLIGSGAKNMIMQNGNGLIDFDYNLNVLFYKDMDNCKEIKELIRKVFNKVLKSKGLSDVKDSKSALTTKSLNLKGFDNIEFSIDIGIVINRNGKWYRLIHKKTGDTNKDEYFWVEAPKSQGYQKKAEMIKSVSCWEKVRVEYKRLKNHYLKRNDNNHPSFICYIEAVNNIFNQLKQIGKIN